MEAIMNIEKLVALLNNLYRLTGLKFGLMDERTHEVYSSTWKARFCEMIAAAPGGYAKCVKCDREHAASLPPKSSFCAYTCHAGLTEVVVPVYDEAGAKVATVLFGQTLEVGECEAQWEQTRKLCAWYPDLPALHEAFMELRQMDMQGLRACADIVRSWVDEVHLTRLLAQCGKPEDELLRDYIDTHYALPLTLDRVAQALGMGKTKLCQIVRRATGMTFTAYVTACRLKAAEKMLKETDWSIQQVAERVGIEDNNYFTKLFRQWRGITPSTYRKQQREGLQESSVHA